MSPTFIPPLRLDTISHDSERRVAEALSGLTPEWVVMHSYPWLRPERDTHDAPLREGEADFVLIHPAWGLIVVEVKGGDLELRHRVWRRGGKEIKDPFRQAARNRHALLDAIEDRTRRGVQRGMFTHGDVVILPHHRGHGDLPHDADPRTLIGAHQLGDLEHRLTEASRAFGERPRMDHATFQRLLNALLPTFRVLRCASVDITAEAARLVELTEAQHAALTGLLATRRALIEGVAGSGKTLLAIEFAITLAERGEKVLLLCFNKHLATWMQERLANEPRLRDAAGSACAANFHQLAIAAARAAGLSFDVGGAEEGRFWQQEAAMMLSQAVGLLEGTDGDLRADAVIVDEGQDFEPDWWVPIDELCGGADGRLYVFLDQLQRLRDGAGAPDTAFDAKLHLDTNCRNTRLIAATARGLGDAPMRVLAGAPRGEAPALRRAPNHDAVRGLVEADLRELLLEGTRLDQIALIGPAAWRRGVLAKVEAIAGAPLTDDAARWRTGEALLVTTARAFKGLEADIIVLYDAGAFGNLFTARDLYVAVTRAKHRLFISAPPGEARAALELTVAGACAS